VMREHRVLRRASKDADTGARGPSFETPRKSAAPLAIAAKPLRGDDDSFCPLHHRFLDRFAGVAEIMRGIDERDVGQRLREIPGLAPLA
jgi:hypothetical protein